MASLQIRELPEDVYQMLLARAQREKRSLAQQAIIELRRMPELDARERRRKVLREIGERIERTGGCILDPPPEDLIREDRDR